MTAAPLISVCILAARPDALDMCLASLGAQEHAPPFEVLIGSRAPTPELLGVVSRRFEQTPVCDIGARYPGEARNPLIERARGELLLFLDDDVTVPPDLLRRLADVARAHPDVAVFGGPNETPSGSSVYQVVQGAVLSSRVGAGPVCRRYGPHSAAFVDERWFTLCNLAVRRGVMLPFLEGLTSGEENALLHELSRRGHVMLYQPELRAFHERRNSTRAFATQMVKYGRGRGEQLRRQPSGTRVAYLVPTAFVAYLVLLVPALVTLRNRLILVGPLALYAALVSASAVRIAAGVHRISAVRLAAGLTVTVHLGYGVGLVKGLARRPRRGRHGPIRWVVASGEEESSSRPQRELAPEVN